MRRDPMAQKTGRVEVSSMKTIQRIRLDNFLSFAPGSKAFDLQSLNVLIGRNVQHAPPS
jgi:hypothetical protein